MKTSWIVLACVFATSAYAQFPGGGYSGPSVLSRGAGEIGNRGGQQVDLRYWASVTGVYDSSVQPVALDSKGNLVTVGGLYGVEASYGAYGTHSWRQALLGVNFWGDYRYYSNNSTYGGADDMLSLGYTWQKSKRWILHTNVLAGTIANGLGSLAYGYPSDVNNNLVAQPTSLLLDTRAYYGQGGMDVTYVLSPRTNFTFGGDGFLVRHKSSALVGVNGYNLRGTIEHRLSKVTSIGVAYQHDHFDFPHAFGESEINIGEVFLARTFGRWWNFTLMAGILQVETQGLQQVALDPVIAALLGQGSVIQSFYRSDLYPNGSVSLSRRIKKGNISFNYARTATPGNGIYLTSRSETGGATYSYSSNRKLNFSATLGYSRLSSIGTGYTPYTQANGGAGLTYSLSRAWHLIARYDYRYQDIASVSYKHEGYRATFGVSFSPGDIPLSLW